ncbi:MAG: hypothetical protein COB85_06750 [Bacteroidetes bacterium]|nr:MAG: hypothetical protein COB85_06750 [Bacteroidota bacterium]
MHSLKGNINLSLELNKKAMDIRLRMGDKKGMAYSYNNIGVIYDRQGLTVKAMEFHHMALSLREELKDTNGISQSLNNIGFIIGTQGDYEGARKYYMRSLELRKKINNKVGIGYSCNNIAWTYEQAGDKEKAKEYYLQSLQFTTEINHASGMANAYSHLGFLHYEEARESGNPNSPLIDSASVYFHRGLVILQEIGFQSGEGRAFVNLSRIAVLRADHVQSYELVINALEISKGIENIILLRDCEQQLSLVYAAMKNFKKAQFHHKAYMVLQDSLTNEQNSKKLGKVEARFEIIRKIEEEERVDQAHQGEILKAKNRSDNIQYSGIMVFMLVLVVLVLMNGRIHFSERMAGGLVFFTFLLLFEFSLVLLDPYIEEYSSGAPVIKLAFNALLAAFIFPLHSFFESILKRRLVR